MKFMQRLIRILSAVAAFVLAGCASHLPETRVVFPKASINGHPARMDLDTGSSSTVLFAARAKRLGLKAAELSGPTPLTIAGQTFTAPLPMFRFPWYYRLVFITRKRPSLDGVVGWPEIYDNILVFDADRRTVRSVEQLPPETAGWLKLKLVPNRWLLLEIPMADGKTGTMEVDTGSPFGVEMPPGQWQEWKAAHPKAAVTSHLGGVLSFGIHFWHMAWADEIQLGLLTVTNVVVEDMPAAQGAYIRGNTPGAKAVWTIGMYALRRMDLVVDGKNGFAYLHPKPPPGPPYPGVKRPGAPQVMTNAPDTGGDWSVADDVRLRGDGLYVMSGKFKCGKDDLAGALADFNCALELNPKNAEAYSRRGVVREIQGDFAGALSDYDKVIELSPDGSDWERLYRQTLLWRLGRTPEDFAKTLAGCKEGWTKTLGLFLVEKLDEKALLAAAEKSDGESVPVQKALARYYIGMMRLSKGDKAGARDSFRKCRAAGMTSDDEYHFAGAELRRLGK
jgi:hypothetical protein